MPANLTKKALRQISRQGKDLAEQAKVRLGMHRHFDVIVCAESIEIAQAQVHPIVDWVTDHKVGWISRRNAYHAQLWKRCQPDYAFVQGYWDTPFEEIESLVRLIREESPDCRICYLDWFAPAHIPDPRIIDLVDLYVKKNLLKDRRKYLEGMPDTNLVEYEAQWDAGFLKPRQGALRDDQLSKLVPGWSFATDRTMIRLLATPFNGERKRPIDLHCRIAAPTGQGWYSHMRTRVFQAVSNLDSRTNGEFQILCDTARVDYAPYLEELRRSSSCLSPFGYGEVCWRDFEAIALGCVLVKPDMNHLQVAPKIYVDFETYVPLDWQLTNLGEKLTALRDEKLRATLVSNARDIWQTFVNSGWQRMWQDLLDRLHARS